MVLLAAVSVASVVAVPAPAGASDIPVTVFNYPGLNGSGDSCDNENTNLLSIVDVLDGYAVDGSITDFESDDDPEQDFGTLLDASRFFFMTDMENKNPSSADFFPVSAQEKLEDWVDTGGVLVMTGTYSSYDNDFLNLVFGWDLGRSTASSSWSKNTTNTAGTPFDDIDGTLPGPSATDAISSGTVESFKAMWGTDDDATVAVIRYGNGYVIFLGYDFFNTGANSADTSYRSSGGACPAYSNVWVQDVLPAALAYATQLSDSRLSSISQTGATLTYSFSSSGTTSLIVTASTATAPSAAQVKAGVDYGDVTVVTTATKSTTASVDAEFTLAGLSASTNYAIHVVTEYDNEGVTTLSGVTTIPFSTIADGEEVRGSGPSDSEPDPAPAPPSAPTPVSDPGGAIPVVPPGTSTGSVGGVPATPNAAPSSPGEAEFRVGMVQTRIDVAVAGAGGVDGPDDAPVLRAVRDRVATISGGGMRPNEVAEVWLPSPDGRSRRVALLRVAEDGTFDGALPFTGELDGQGPLPIGDRTLQLYGVDASGRLTVLNVGVRIEQPDPLAPEPERTPGAPPTLTPGQSLATNAGVPEPVTVTPIPDARTTRVEGSGWLMEIDVPEGEVADQAGAPVIRVAAGDDTEVRGTGFMPSTRAYVWLMSDPTFLGEVTVDATGKFEGDVPLAGIAPGEHTLQLSGVGTDGYVRAANLGVIVTGETVPSSIPAGGGPTPVAPLPFVLTLALAAVGVVLLERRRAAGPLSNRSEPVRPLAGGPTLGTFDALAERLERIERRLR